MKALSVVLSRALRSCERHKKECHVGCKGSPKCVCWHELGHDKDQSLSPKEPMKPAQVRLRGVAKAKPALALSTNVDSVQNR